MLSNALDFYYSGNGSQASVKSVISKRHHHRNYRPRLVKTRAPLVTSDEEVSNRLYYRHRYGLHYADFQWRYTKAYRRLINEVEYPYALKYANVFKGKPIHLIFG